MNKLSKKEMSQQDDHVLALEEARDTLKTAIDAYNENVAKEWKVLETAIESYNEVVQSAEEFREDIHSVQEEFFGNKAERWQEGEKGESYSQWMETWDVALEEVEFEEPAVIELEGDDPADLIRDLPASPE